MAVLGRSRDASFEYEKHGGLVPLPLPGHELQFFGPPPGASPPAGLYSSALNCVTITGTLLTRWYAEPAAMTDAVMGVAEPCSFVSGPFSAGTHGR